MLRIALPNKGQLSDPAKAMLAEAGYRRARNPRDLVITDHDNDVEFFLLRPRDIATYVGSGTLDFGITGRDLLADSTADAEEAMALGFAPSTFRLAAPADVAGSPGDLAGRRIATSYPELLRTYLTAIGVDAAVVRLDGAVENAVRLGVADAVADVVDTGATLRQAGLHIIGEPILYSEALLIRRRGAAPAPGAEVFVRRLQGVLTARAYVLVDYDIPLDLVERACELTPGLESPTVSPLREQGWAAVRAVVPKAEVHRVMDRLADIGGRGILVTAISACRV
jgi:ATP phosphoribosyltransferase